MSDIIVKIISYQLSVFMISKRRIFKEGNAKTCEKMINFNAAFAPDFDRRQSGIYTGRGFSLCDRFSFFSARPELLKEKKPNYTNNSVKL